MGSDNTNAGSASDTTTHNNATALVLVAAASMLLTLWAVVFQSRSGWFVCLAVLLFSLACMLVGSLRKHLFCWVDVQSTTRQFVLLGIVAVFMIVGLTQYEPAPDIGYQYPTVVGSPSTIHDSLDSIQIEAWTVAQGIVEKYLSSPSTASYGGILSDFQDPREHVRQIGDNTYEVIGWVDSQNAFGAIRRSHFRIRLKKAGNSWEQIDDPFLVEQ